MSKTVAILIQPVVIAFALTLIGLILLFTRNWRWGRALIAAAMALNFVPVFVPVNPWLTAFLENRFSAPQSLGRVDGIIVLGGSLNPPVSHSRGRPTVSQAADRLFALAVLARRYPEAKVIFTGGSSDPLDENSKEAPWVRRLVADLGFPPGRILFEDQARNTHENAVFSKTLANPQPGETWLLVTSAVHMPRAMGSFRAAGWKIRPYPVDYRTEIRRATSSVIYDADPITGLASMEGILHEVLGLVWYRIKGWTDAIVPAPDAGEAGGAPAL